MAIAILGILGAVTAGLALSVARTLAVHRRASPDAQHPQARVLVPSMVILWAATAWFASATLFQALDALTS